MYSYTVPLKEGIVKPKDRFFAGLTFELTGFCGAAEQKSSELLAPYLPYNSDDCKSYNKQTKIERNILLC